MYRYSSHHQLRGGERSDDKFLVLPPIFGLSFCLTLCVKSIGIAFSQYSCVAS